MNTLQRFQRSTGQAVHSSTEKEIACSLGLASIAIGQTELLAPRQIERTMGIGNDQHTGILRVLGVRELMHGLDLLTHPDPVPGLWARVAGDTLDSVLLVAAATKSKRLGGFAAIAALVLPVVVADMVAAPVLTHRKAAAQKKSSWLARLWS